MQRSASAFVATFEDLPVVFVCLFVCFVFGVGVVCLLVCLGFVVVVVLFVWFLFVCLFVCFILKHCRLFSKPIICKMNFSKSSLADTPNNRHSDVS